MSSDCEPQYDTGVDGWVTVVLDGVVVFSLGWFGIILALGDMYGDCKAETNAEDGGDMREGEL